MVAKLVSSLKADMPLNAVGGISGEDIYNLIDTVEGRSAVSVRQYGAVGDGVADDTAAIQAALSQNAWKTVFFPAGLYRTTSVLSIPNATNIRLIGEGGTNTTIRRFGNGAVLELYDATFCSIEELAFQHGSGTGSGVIFWGINGSNNVDRCFFAINAGGHGLAFSGTEAIPQSGNRVTRCLFLENGLEQLYMFWAHDPVIVNNAFGGGTGPYSTAGCYLHNSHAGQYVGNEHWNNRYALRLENSDMLRIIGNRFEESREEGIYANLSNWCVFNGNFIHTNSQAATGTYSALRLIASANWNITGNQVMSWNTLRHKHSIEADATSSDLNISGNMLNHHNLAAINTNSAPRVWLSSNAPP
jgi:hypothetical protein